MSRCTPIQSTTLDGLATFRVDIDVATCGEITPFRPLTILSLPLILISSPLITGCGALLGTSPVKSLFLDHKITSIQDFISPEILIKYDAIDLNVYEANLFHTKLLIKELDLQNYLLTQMTYELPPKERMEIAASLRQEMIEIFSGRNVFNEGV